MYYRNKIESLQKLFGTTDLELTSASLRVGPKTFPIRDDVIDITATVANTAAAEDIQFTFGAEWSTHHHILPEHQEEFHRYFDLVDLTSFKDSRVCDLGCGSGRWSYFLKDHCKEIVLIDFSDAIFVARENLRAASHCIFLKADIAQLPLAENSLDFLFCLGVLHHMPVPCFDVVRSLRRFAPKLLIFLYYALDNRPFYFRILLKGVTLARLLLARIRSPFLRKGISLLGTGLVYVPLILLGHVLNLADLGRFVPLYEFYKNKSLRRIEQDVYDRFFTRIEQRVSRAQIQQLERDFSQVRISNHIPYWHFLLVR